MQAVRENAHRPSDDTGVLDLEARAEREVLQARNAEQLGSSVENSRSSSSSSADGIVEGMRQVPVTSSASAASTSETLASSSSSSSEKTAFVKSGIETSSMVEDS